MNSRRVKTSKGRKRDQKQDKNPASKENNLDILTGKGITNHHLNRMFLGDNKPEGNVSEYKEN